MEEKMGTTSQETHINADVDSPTINKEKAKGSFAEWFEKYAFVFFAFLLLLGFSIMTLLKHYKAVMFTSDDASLWATVIMNLIALPAITFIDKYVDKKALKITLISIVSILFIALLSGFVTLSNNKKEKVVAPDSNSYVTTSETTKNIEHSPQSEIVTGGKSEETEKGEYVTPEDIEKDHNNQDDKFIPSLKEYEGELFRHVVFLEPSFSTDIQSPHEYSTKAYNIARENIERMLHKKEDVSNEEVTSNKDINDKTTEANKIDENNIFLATEQNFKDMIRLREECFSILEYREICNQLARNYAELMLFLPKERREEKFINGLNSVLFLENTLSYEHVGAQEDDGNLYYRIGHVYHALGDVSNLESKLRHELYLISSLYFKMAQENTVTGYYTYMDFYYCGMTNHKLGVISEKNNFFYLLEAEKNYKAVLSHSSNLKETTRKDTHSFLADIYDRLCRYIQKYGMREELLSVNEYQTLAKENRNKGWG